MARSPYLIWLTSYMHVVTAFVLQNDAHGNH